MFTPLPKTPGIALKQPHEAADLQDHLPMRVYVRAERFVESWGAQIDLVLLGREDLHRREALALLNSLSLSADLPLALFLVSTGTWK